MGYENIKFMLLKKNNIKDIRKPIKYYLQHILNLVYI